MGEDIASLIADDTKTENLDEYYRRFIPAYYRGAGEFMRVPEERGQICNMILIKFGYRLLQSYMFAQTEEERADSISRLQRIFDWGGR